MPKNWLSNGIRLLLGGRFEVVESAHPRTGLPTKGLVISPDELSQRCFTLPTASQFLFLPITFIPDGIICRIESP